MKAIQQRSALSATLLLHNNVVGDLASEALPSRYVPARWRDMTPIDPTTGDLGLGFVVGDEVAFLRLHEADVAQIAEQLAVYRETRTTSQSPSESGRTEIRGAQPGGNAEMHALNGIAMRRPRRVVAADLVALHEEVLAASCVRHDRDVAAPRAPDISVIQIRDLPRPRVVAIARADDSPGRGPSALHHGPQRAAWSSSPPLPSVAYSG